MTIKIGDVRPLFLTKQGLPRKEVLLSAEDILASLDDRTPDTPAERAYVYHSLRRVLSELKRAFFDSHCLFIAPRIDGLVYYGFTNDPELIQNYVSRMHRLTLSYRRLETDIKMMRGGQLALALEAS